MRSEHDDAMVGAYLAGELPEGEREAFETHLLTCDPCWTEVGTGRRGRALARLAWEPAPPHLAAAVAARVATAAGGTSGRSRSAARWGGLPRLRPHLPGAGRTRRSWALAAAVVALVAVLGVVVGGRVEPPSPAGPIAMAVEGYRDERLPGTEVPARPGPDLSVLQLSDAGASAGQLAGQPVTGYAYRDETGRRLLLYLSDRPFPMSGQVERPVGSDGAGLMRIDGVVVLCSRRPHTALVIGEDENLVRQAAVVLDLT